MKALKLAGLFVGGFVGGLGAAILTGAVLARQLGAAARRAGVSL